MKHLLLIAIFLSLAASPAHASPSAMDNWQSALNTSLKSQCADNFSKAESNWLNTVNKAEHLPNNYLQLCESLYGLYDFYRQEKRYDKAILTMKRYIKLRQQHPEDRFFYLISWHQCELGDLYFLKKDWSQAISQYEQAVKSWEITRHYLSMIQPYDRLAKCYLHTGQKARAAACVQLSLNAAQKALDLPGLERQRYLVQYLQASSFIDYGTNFNQPDKIKKGNALLVTLSNHFNVPNEPKRLLTALANHYCQMGKYVESEILFDMMDISAAERCRHFQECSAPPKEYADTNNNPFLKEFAGLTSRRDFFSRKSQLVSKYAYAIPTNAAIQMFRQYQPIVEIGAGTGYWAFLMRNAGIKVTAYERYPLSAGKNVWFPGAKDWTKVLPGDEFAASAHPDSTLFLCWPPGRYPVAYNALRTFKGNHVIHVGALGYGDNEDNFQALLKKDWQLEKQIDLPQWIGDYEALFVYKRKSAQK